MEVLRKHSLHDNNSRLGFIEAVQQWKCKNATPLFSNVNNIQSTISKDQKNMNSQG